MASRVFPTQDLDGNGKSRFSFGIVNNKFSSNGLVGLIMAAFGLGNEWVKSSGRSARQYEYENEGMEKFVA
ncbi:hypothetical protein ACFQZT_06450 [Paenibacillus sp. GCM10027628]|uniref:hypothetical protein n=1 Tax=Paenibacillus sp. GCM10027628 TaxID=3273413 RepID=UPI00362B0B27